VTGVQTCALPISAYSGGEAGKASGLEFQGLGDARGLPGQGTASAVQSPGSLDADLDPNGAADIAPDQVQSTAEMFGWSAPLAAFAARAARKKRNRAARETAAGGDTPRTVAVDHARNPRKHAIGAMAAAGAAVAGVLERLLRQSAPTRQTKAPPAMKHPHAEAKLEPEENRVTYLSMTVEEIVTGLRAGAPDRDVDVSIEQDVTALGPLEAIRPAMRAMLTHAWARTAGVSQARVAFGVEMRDGSPAYFVSDNGPPMPEVGDNIWPESNEVRGGRPRLDAAQKIVERHGGRMWAEDAPGGDTALYLAFSKVKT